MSVAHTFRWKKLATVLFVGVSWVGLASAATLHVPSEYPTIQAAIDATQEGDRVLVAPGIYFETLDFGTRSIVVASTDGPQATIVDAKGDGSVVRFGTSGEGAVLFGFTITGGTGTLRSQSEFGGGVLIEGASPRIEGNVIRDCEATFGGGIACLGGGAALIRDNEICGNSAAGSSGSGQGGGVYVDEGSQPEIVGNLFRRNGGGDGGSGIYVRGFSAALIEKNRFERHRPGLLGGTVQLFDAHGSRILGNEFLPADETSLDMHRSDDVRVEGNWFGGEGQFAGGLQIRRARGLQLYRNVFVGNQCHIWESHEINMAANYHASANMFLDSCQAARMHGCVFVDTFGNANQYEFGAVGGQVEIAHCTFLGRGDSATGVYLTRSGSANIVNSILWGEAEAVNLASGGTAIVQYSIVRGGWPGAGNLDARPRIVRRDGDFHLMPGSPGIDRAIHINHLLDFDADGDPRELGNAPDMGADEFRLDIAARYGTVGGGEPVLTVNGSSGDVRRVVDLERFESIRVDLQPAMAGPDPARYVVYAWRGEPDASTLRLQPFGLGWTVFPTPLQPEMTNQPIAIWNTLGRFGKLGQGSGTALAPVTLVDRPRGIGVETSFTLQGFLEDADSQAEGPVSITNAVVVRVGFDPGD